MILEGRGTLFEGFANRSDSCWGTMKMTGGFFGCHYGLLEAN